MPVVYSDDFNDGIRADGPWTYLSAGGMGTTGNTAEEHLGYLDLRMDVTDDGGMAMYTLPGSMSSGLLELRAMFHAEETSGQYFYYGGFELLFTSGTATQAVFFGMYQTDFGNIYNPKLTSNGFFDTPEIAASAAVLSASLMDQWLDLSLGFDTATGEIWMDLQGDGVRDIQMNDAHIQGLDLTSIRFQPFGWWTGHYLRLDSFSLTGETNAVNRAPELAAVPDRAVYRGEPVQISLGWMAFDADSDALTFAATGLPTGLQLSAAGTITGTPTAVAGRYEYTVTVSDGQGGTDTDTAAIIVRRALTPTAQLMADEGAMRIAAHLSNAAYHQATSESGRSQWSETTSHTASYQWVVSHLQLLTTVDLPDLVLQESTGGNGTYYRNGLSQGIFNSANAAALVARSEDTVFLAFRGTNEDADVLDWADRGAHWSEFTRLTNEIVAYVGAEAAGGHPVERIFLTGHSLGGGMVQYAYNALRAALPGIAFEGVTFATPGSEGVDAPANTPEITNFVNSFDPIRVPQYLSDVWGQTYQFNTLSSVNAALSALNPFTFFDHVTDSHAMEGYVAIADAFAAEQVTIADIRARFVALPAWVPDWFGLEARQLRVHIALANPVDGQPFYAGTGRDVIIAGLVETGAALLSGVVGLADDLNGLTTVFNQVMSARNKLDVAVAPNALNVADLVLDVADSILNPNALGAAVQRFAVLYEIGKTAIDAANAYFASDLVLGRGGDDYLNGLGGHDLLIGGTGNDVLVGLQGVDKLVGGEGNDLLDGRDGFTFGLGGTAQDLLEGGVGNDTYIIDSVNDRVFESSAANGGIDTVHSTVTHTLGVLVENLLLTDTGLSSLLVQPTGIDGTGNGTANAITGGFRGNLLRGGGGNDTLQGAGGRDTVEGGLGNDVIIVRQGDIRGDEVIRGGDGTDQLWIVGNVDLSGLSVMSGLEQISFGVRTIGATSRLDLDSDQITHVETSTLPSNLRLNGASLGNAHLRINLTESNFAMDQFSFADWTASDGSRLWATFRQKRCAGRGRQTPFPAMRAMMC
jgi:Ca2+-binding RTX toxin-like protein